MGTLQVTAMLHDAVPVAALPPKGNTAPAAPAKGFDRALKEREASRSDSDDGAPRGDAAEPAARKGAVPTGTPAKRAPQKAQLQAVKKQRDPASPKEDQDNAAEAGEDSTSAGRMVLAKEKEGAPRKDAARQAEDEVISAREGGQGGANTAATAGNGNAATQAASAESTCTESGSQESVGVAQLEAALAAGEGTPSAVVEGDGASGAEASGVAADDTAGKAQQEAAAAQTANAKGAGFIAAQPKGAFFHQTVASAHGIAKEEPPGLAKAATVIAENRERQEALAADKQGEAPQTRAAGGATVAAEGQQVKEGGNKIEGVTASKVQQQQPGILQKGEAKAQEMKGVPLADKKEPQHAEQSHGRHGAFPGEVAELKGGAPKVPVEEISGTKAASAADTAKPSATQEGPGQKGSGDAAGKGHQEQKAQMTQGNDLIGTAVAGQGPAAEVAAEARPSGQRSALHENILAQVKEGVVTHDGKGNGQMSIRLNPGELGELKIQVRMENHRLVVDVQADNRVVKDLLMNNLDSLREALSGKNLAMDGFNVSTGAGGGFGNPLAEQRGSSQQTAPRMTRSGGYGDAGRPEGRVKYLTAEVNSLLDVRF